MLYEVAGGVKEVPPGKLLLSDGQRVPFDECLWSTQASAASWLAETGLPVDAGGAAGPSVVAAVVRGPLAVVSSNLCAAVDHPAVASTHVRPPNNALLHALQMVSCLWTSACAARAARPTSLPRATWPPAGPTQGPRPACLRFVRCVYHMPLCVQCFCLAYLWHCCVCNPGLHLPGPFPAGPSPGREPAALSGG